MVGIQDILVRNDCQGASHHSLHFQDCVYKVYIVEDGLTHPPLPQWEVRKCNQATRASSPPITSSLGAPPALLSEPPTTSSLTAPQLLMAGHCLSSPFLGACLLRAPTLPFQFPSPCLNSSPRPPHLLISSVSPGLSPVPELRSPPASSPLHNYA